MTEPALQLLEFQLNNLRCALHERDVVEVLAAASVVALPSAPPIVMGLVNVRGTLVPVLDIRPRLKLPPKPIEPSDHFIITQAAGRRVALHVDRAQALIPIEMSAIDSAAEFREARGIIGGVARTEDGLLLIHDPERFLLEAEAIGIDQAMAGPQG